MVTVNTCYDKNIHFTRDKYKAKTGIDIDIQTAIERPEIHILTKNILIHWRPVITQCHTIIVYTRHNLWNWTATWEKTNR